ncbi:PPE domain-containing protein [Nocardia abscessus]|uniref:PPE domain-containing protein n=1 Tax=Nocardia abscessus TaxID=120957 RepID=A0ABS0CEH6_9NOCA|nr:PPE domain-containing protein [Nocardia abscessus]MBF6228742.1 PPE domain-containing protein [Nocardia abscessus]
MAFDYLALPPEVNTGRLLSGPGAAALASTAAAYATLATGLAVAASETDGLTVMLGVAWQGPASDVAQAAFGRHAAWLHTQSAVALDAATSAAELGVIFSEAQGAMMGVAAWLTAWYVKQAALAAASTTQLAPLTLAAMAASELEYLAIAAAAAAVMVGYDSAASAVLAGLPAPEVPLPIVNGGSIREGRSFVFDPPRVEDPTISDHGPHTSRSDVGSNQTADPGTSNPDPTSPQPVDTTQPTDPLPDMDNPSSPSDSPANSSANGSGAGSMDQQGLIGTTQDSITLAGLSGGVGSMVALSMMRGGPSVMSGAANGFRMPSNWSIGRGTAFGASPSQPGGGPAFRSNAPRGATAPNAQMRRRRRGDEDRKKSKVFVPGEPQDIPVPERPPVIGVIEYGDADRREEPEIPETEQLLPIGVIESAADEPTTADEEPGR